MPRDYRGREASLLEHAVLPKAERANGGLGVGGLAEGGFLFVGGGAIEGVGRVDYRREGRVAILLEQCIEGAEWAAQVRAVDGQLAPHADVLRSLPGKQGNHAPLCFGCCAAVENTFGVLPFGGIGLLA